MKAKQINVGREKKEIQSIIVTIKTIAIVRIHICPAISKNQRFSVLVLPFY